MKYRLDDQHYLLLTREERKIKQHKRYFNSPFPLLSNLEFFSNTLGEWNKSLLTYGLKTRVKNDDPCEKTSLGSHIYLSSYTTGNYKSNRYLKTQYKRLEKYRSTRNVKSYWKLSWDLMQKSMSYKIASLNSWQPKWYSELAPYEIQKIFHQLNSILRFQELTCPIKNVWIESPQNKWRQLGIPTRPWRLYYHMLNQFLSYIYEPHLPSAQYEGFMFNRGCKSFWEDIIWGPFLKKWDSLLEVDVSSGFPNINLHHVRTSLLQDQLIPKNIIELIMHHLSCPVQRAQWYPTLSTYIEDRANESWRSSSRCLPMGIGISPILFVVSLKSSLQKILPLNDFLIYKWYADDGNIYFNFTGLSKWLLRRYNIIYILWDLIRLQNPLLNYLNNTSEFRHAGIKLCNQKSKLVRLKQIWLNDYISLGARLYTRCSIYEQIKRILSCQSIPLEFSGWTRGRGSNPVKGTSATPPSRQALQYKIPGKHNPCLNYEQLQTNYKHYWGLILSRLYGNHYESSPPKTSRISAKSFLGYLLKRHPWSRLRKKFHINSYNKSSRVLNWILKVNNHEKLESQITNSYPNLKRMLTLPSFNQPHLSILTTEFSNPLPLSPHEPKKNTEFKKYSELKLKPDEVAAFEQDYILNQKFKPM